jgi:uncharacterized membrane protein YgcG
MIIPGAPQGGGDLAKYLTKYSAEIGWMPAGTSDIGLEIQAALDGSKNDPVMWVSFAAASLQRVWDALPEDIRTSAQIALSQLIDLGMRGLGQLGEAASAAVGSVAGAVPIIGMIIEALLAAIYGFVDLAKAQEDKRKNTAALHFMDSTRWTVERLEHPNDWVFASSKVANYLNRASRDWWIKPSFSRAGRASDLMFTGTTGRSDKGDCSGKGVEVYCGARTYVNSADCRKRHDDETFCTRYVSFSALFFPFWSPAYPDLSSVKEKASHSNPHLEGRGFFDADIVTANTLLMARQMALLSSPTVNLRVDARRLLRIRDHFRNWFTNTSKAFGSYAGGEFGVLPVNRHHILQRGDGAFSIDARKRPGFPKSQSDQNKFYFGDDGLIYSYGDAVDLTNWGVPAKRGQGTPADAAVTIAQYNSVISATLAFMSARANFLRNGPTMRRLLADHKLRSFDRRVRLAMRYSADLGEMLPPPTGSVSTPGRAQGGHGRRGGGRGGRGGRGSEGDSSTGGGAGGLVVAGGAAAALILFLRR